MTPEILLSESRLHSIATSLEFAATQLSLMLNDDPHAPTDLTAHAAEKCRSIAHECRHLNELLTVLAEYGNIRRA